MTNSVFVLLSESDRISNPTIITRYVTTAVCVSHSAVSDSLQPHGAHQAPLVMEFFRQQSWSGLPFLSPGDLPNSGLEPASPAAPALAGRSFTTEPPEKYPTELAETLIPLKPSETGSQY